MSVELVFDNSAGRIGGQWGQFVELSIKRVLSRDGDSNYYINNIPVRRRDIHDLFLGTGLGPRAYRFGKHLKFAVSDVRAWIEQQRELDPPEATGR